MPREIQVGVKFTDRVPNGRKLAVNINLSGQREPTVKIINSISYKPPTITYIGQTAIIHFTDDTPIGASVEMVVLENGHYLDASFENEIKAVKSFRKEIEESTNSLYPSFSYHSAITFDQCHWTRSIGQIEIAKGLEGKLNTKLSSTYQLFGAVGFGAIQALHFALGGESSALLEFWLGPLKKSLKQTKSFFSAQRSSKPVERALKKFFTNSITKQNLLMKDLRGEVFLPLMDINGKCLALSRADYPMMPVYEAAILCVLDPVEFRSKHYLDGFSIIDSNIAKNVDSLLKVNNPRLAITSIGAPARVINHGKKVRTRENLAIINQERHNRLTLLNQEVGKAKRTRYECYPIDHIKKFDFSKKAVGAAINSAHSVV